MLHAYPQNLCLEPCKQVHRTKVKHTSTLQSHSPCQTLGDACALASPEIRRGLGRSSGNLGNIPEAADCVSLWRAQQFWNLRFLVLVEATVGKRQGRLYWPGRALQPSAPPSLKFRAAARGDRWRRVSVPSGPKRLGRGSLLQTARLRLSVFSECICVSRCVAWVCLCLARVL